MENIQTLTKEKIKLEEPSMYDVVFLNDNFTLAQMLQAMEIINEQLTQDGYDPINLDLLQ